MIATLSPLRGESGGPACARNGAAPAGPPDAFPERKKRNAGRVERGNVEGEIKEGVHTFLHFIQILCGFTVCTKTKLGPRISFLTVL